MADAWLSQSPAMKAYDCFLHPRAVRHHGGERNPIGSLRWRLAPFAFLLLTPLLWGWALRASQAQGDRRSRKSSHRRRGDKRFRTTAGDCTGDKVAKWYVDCDGGGVTIENGPEKRGLRVLLQGEGIAFGNDCDTTRGTFVGPAPTTRFLIWSPHRFRNARIWRNGRGRDRTGCQSRGGSSHLGRRRTLVDSPEWR